jgi:hypothetical protein
MVNALIQDGPSPLDRFSDNILFKFSLLHRFYAHCHRQDPARAFHLPIADAALTASLESYERLRRYLVLPVFTVIVNQGAEWIVNAGDDLATACLCQTRLPDINRIFFEYSPFVKNLDTPDGTLVLRREQRDVYAFNVQRWENWKRTLRATIEHHEVKIASLKRKLSNLNRNDKRADFNLDLKRTKSRLAQCVEALQVIDGLDIKRKHIHNLIKGVKNEAGANKAQQAIKQLYRPVAEPLQPVGAERGRGTLLQNVGLGQDVPEANITAVVLNAADVEWRSRARFIWAAVNDSYRSHESREDFPSIAATDLPRRLVQDISTMCKATLDPEAAFTCFLHLSQIFMVRLPKIFEGG